MPPHHHLVCIFNGLATPSLDINLSVSRIRQNVENLFGSWFSPWLSGMDGGLFADITLTILFVFVNYVWVWVCVCVSMCSLLTLPYPHYFQCYLSALESWDSLERKANGCATFSIQQRLSVYACVRVCVCFYFSPWRNKHIRRLLPKCV